MQTTHLHLHTNRRGGHLLEVLIALAVMAIGMISGVSLFTAAVDRSAKAAKITRATDLRNNAEATIRIHPSIVKNPQVILNQNGMVNESAHRGEVFAFDPLGLAITGQPKFGNLNRYCGTWANATAAESLCVEPDTWSTQWESLREFEITPVMTPAVGVSRFVSITLPTVISIPSDGSTRLRITLFSTDWARSESRIPVTATPTADGKGTVFSWWRDANQNGVIDGGEGSLPDGLVKMSHATGAPVYTIGKIKVELSERRYSWMLTVRQNEAGDCMPSVAVYFQRSFDPADETVYPASGREGDSRLTIQAPREKLKAGAFIFDADRGWWYRIQAVNGQTVTIETPACADVKAVVLPKGIVDVWPLRQM